MSSSGKYVGVFARAKSTLNKAAKRQPPALCTWILIMLHSELSLSFPVGRQFPDSSDQ